MTARPPLPPFNAETATQKALMAGDAWNSRNPQHVFLVYTEDSVWRNRAKFLQGRPEIAAILDRNWTREFDDYLIEEAWTFGENRRRAVRLRMAIRFRPVVQKLRQRELGARPHGLMQRRVASISHLTISEIDRSFRWPLGRRSDDHPGVNALSL